jgi:hypothetical protein
LSGLENAAGKSYLQSREIVPNAMDLPKSLFAESSNLELILNRILSSLDSHANSRDVSEDED